MVAIAFELQLLINQRGVHDRVLLIMTIYVQSGNIKTWLCFVDTTNCWQIQLVSLCTGHL